MIASNSYTDRHAVGGALNVFHLVGEHQQVVLDVIEAVWRRLAF